MHGLRAFVQSLKFKLTLGAMVALALGVGVVAVLLVRQTELDTLRAQRQRQVSDTVRTAQVLARRVVDLQRALALSAKQLSPDMVGDSARLAELIAAKPVLNGMFSSVYVVSSAGVLVLLQQGTSQVFPNTDLSDRDYIRKTLREGRPIISEPLTSRVTGESMIAFTYPLRQDGVTYGVLAGSTTLSSRGLLADLVDGDDSGSLLAVTDVGGRILAHPESVDVLTPIGRQPRFAEAFRDWESQGSPAEPSGLSLSQQGDVVSVSGVAGTDWLVWRALSEQEVLAPLRAARTQASKLVIGLVAVMSLIVFALMAWLLRPLASVAARAQHLFDGRESPHAGWPRVGGELGQLTSVLRHVGAERSELEARNDATLKQLTSVMSAAPIGIAFTRNRRFALVSAELCRLLGRPESELLGQSIKLVHADLAQYVRMLDEIRCAFERHVPYQGECTIVRADGSRFHAQVLGRPVDGDWQGNDSIWTMADITAQVAAREHLEWSASHDALTGLANRKLLEQRLRDVFVLPRETVRSAVVAIDLDHFKSVNDQAGHGAGDAMLKAVATAIGTCVRASDLVARTGGDEFALVLTDCPDAVALRIAQDVHDAIAAIVLPWDAREFRVGASVGVSRLRADTASVDAWLAEADAACYEVKRSGRGAVRSTPGSTVQVLATWAAAKRAG